MDTRGQLRAKIAQDLIFTGKSYINSPIVEEAICDILLNRYGEDYITIADRFLDSVKALNRDLAYIQFCLLRLVFTTGLDLSGNILYIGPDPRTFIFALLDTRALLKNIGVLTGQPMANRSTRLFFKSPSNQDIERVKEGVSYLITRLRTKLDLDGLTIDRLDETETELAGGQTDPWDLIVIRDPSSLDKGNDFLIDHRDRLRVGGGLIIVQPPRAGIQGMIREIAAWVKRLAYRPGQEYCLEAISPCYMSKSCIGCRLCLEGFDIKSRLIDDIVASSPSGKGLKTVASLGKKTGILDEWMYLILRKTKGQKTSTSKKIERLDQKPIDRPISCEFSIISPVNRDDYISICDGLSGPMRFSIDLVEAKTQALALGDRIRAENIIIKEGEKGKGFKITEDTKITNLTNRSLKARLDQVNIDEGALGFLLKRLWGFDDYREGQLAIIKQALLAKNTLGILPTGAGKSLCFQLPALLRPGISLVISPLKSLMKDQIDHLKASGFDYVAYLDSSMKKHSKDRILRDLKLARLRLLYISPERLQIKDFQDELVALLEDEKINYLILDEAHCASEWGHDFRPAYLKVRDVARRLGDPTILALTATASSKVLDDIMEIFGLDRDGLILPRTYDRPELSFEVITRPVGESKADSLAYLLRERIPSLLGYSKLEDLHQQGSGIVFTIYADPRSSYTKTYGTEHIKDILDNWGLPAERYHSRLDDELRIDIQDQYIRGQIPLLVSTKGFGMGIDKANIRYIIHMCFSNSLEAYYQEAGRCGRDKGHAHVVLVASKRHPSCIKGSSYRQEPACIEKWTCAYKRGPKCDYGMQAKFICDEYGNRSKMKKDLNRFIDRLIREARGRKEFTIKLDQDSLISGQKYLYYLQRESVVRDYFILEYLADAVQILVHLERPFNRVKFSKLLARILDRLQAFKEQKLNMLETMWTYVDSSHICRRQFIMTYFGDRSDYQGGCGFCDVEGISRDKALKSTREREIEDLYQRLTILLNEPHFDYGTINGLVAEIYAEGIQENIKIRAMKYLEDYPDNLLALYLTAIITLRRDKDLAYGQSQLLKALTILENKANYETILYILKDLIPIGEDLVKDLLDSLCSPYDKADLIRPLYNCLRDKQIKDHIYKKYIEAQLSRVNGKLEGVRNKNDFK